MSRLADGVLIVHVLYVAFVVGGLLLILCGAWRDWRWTRNVWFRALHLLAIAIVVLQSWLGIECPLTTFERWLRSDAGAVGEHQLGFIAYWLQQLLFFSAPGWVFILSYTLFGGLVLATLRWHPPRRRLP